jgi:hypothetical protein
VHVAPLQRAPRPEGAHRDATSYGGARARRCEPAPEHARDPHVATIPLPSTLQRARGPGARIFIADTATSYGRPGFTSHASAEKRPRMSHQARRSGEREPRTLQPAMEEQRAHPESKLDGIRQNEKLERRALMARAWSWQAARRSAGGAFTDAGPSDARATDTCGHRGHGHPAAPPRPRTMHPARRDEAGRLYLLQPDLHERREAS